MAYQAQAIDTTEPFSDSDWEISANVGDYNVVSGCALTYDSGNMTVDVAAGVITHNGSLVTVAAVTNAVTLVSDGSNPRWTWIHLTSAGVLGITSGTPASTPVKPELGDNVANAVVLIATNATIANDQTKIDKRIPVSQGDISVTYQQFIEGGVQTQFFALGSMSATATYANNTAVGMGFGVSLTSTGTVVQSAAVGWLLDTGSTQNSDIGVIGPKVALSRDWTLVFDGLIDQAGTFSASDNGLVGGITTSASFDDQNDIIAFRQNGTGNIFGVCDSGGTETTRDSGVTGARSLRIEVRSGGTIVRFIVDNVQVGADVTTNIPTGVLEISAGITNGSGANVRRMAIVDLTGWIEAV